MNHINTKIKANHWIRAERIAGKRCSKKISQMRIVIPSPLVAPIWSLSLALCTQSQHVHFPFLLTSLAHPWYCCHLGKLPYIVFQFCNLFLQEARERDNFRNTPSTFATLTTFQRGTVFPFLIGGLCLLWLDALSKHASIFSKTGNPGMESSFYKILKRRLLVLAFFWIKHVFQYIDHIASTW